MASTIKIKRSSINTTPTSLKSGELAYSWAAGGNRLYFGKGDDGSGNATEIIVIGGQYFTDLLDHTPGTLTTSSAIITDANNKINELFVDNLKLDANAISSTNTDGNIELNPNGNGLVSIAGAYTLPRTASTAGYVLTYNGSGAVTFQPSSSQLSINADSGTADVIQLLTDTLLFTGGEGIDTVVSDNTITISGEDASATNKGIAKFTSTDFSVVSGEVFLQTARIKDIIGNSAVGGVGITLTYNTLTYVLTIDADYASTTNVGVASFNSDNFAVTAGGEVTIKDGGVSNDELVFSTVTFGETTVSLGGTSTFISGLTQLTVDNLKFNDSEISSIGTDTNIVLNPNGNGLVSIAGAYTLPRTASTAGYVLTYNGSGAVTFQPSSSTLSVNADNNSPDSVNLLTDTLSFIGGEGIDTNVTDNTITISAEDASATNKGVASFTSTDFSVTSGQVSLVENRIREFASNGIAAGSGIVVSYNSGTYVTTISGDLATTSTVGVASFSNDNFAVDGNGQVTIKDGGVSNAELVNSSITVGSTAISLGSSSTVLAGLTQVDINNIRITGNTISSTNPSGNIVFDPNGSGTVEVSGARITGLAEPLSSTDAATKAYVDAVAEGLHVHAPVKAATTNTLAILSGGTVTYDNGTDGVGATLTLSVGITILDGYTIQNGDRVLIKDEINLAHNGIYIWTTGGTVLTRADDFNSTIEIAGGDFLFVQEGDVYANTGWVETETTTAIGTSDIMFLQFSGAGSYQAGTGLLLNGSVFNINTASNSGLYISGNVLQINPDLAGNGLTYNNGIMAVVGTTDRISVTADAIDIASTYVGQTSITTVGTITSGTWNASTIAAAYGGTGQTTYNYGDLLYGNVGGSLSKLAMGAVGKILQVSTSSELVYGDIDGGTY